MISATKADSLLSSAIRGMTINQHQDLPIQDTTPEILAEHLVADRDGPPFNRVAMDGIAIKFAKWNEGQRDFTIEGIQQAGASCKSLKNTTNCLEVMTGAPLPLNTDTVIPYEHISRWEDKAILENHQVTEGQNIHFQGQDFKQGDPLVAKNLLLTPSRWTVAASMGYSLVKVITRPKIAVVSTGDELVPVEQKPLPHQIRTSNGWTLKASLQQSGFKDVRLIHLKDDSRSMETALAEILDSFDVILLSGGVSMGKFDFVPQALSNLKVENIFHKIQQKPGKPLWFGTYQNQKLVFGLPGNPMSALVCYRRYVLPSLRTMLSLADEPKPYAMMEGTIKLKKGFTNFIPVQIRYDNKGMTYATPLKTNGSGDFSSLIQSDGFVEIPPDVEDTEGQAMRFFPW